MNNPLSFDELLDYLDNQESQFVLDSVAAHGFLTATVIGRPLPNWIDALFESTPVKCLKTLLTVSSAGAMLSWLS